MSALLKLTGRFRSPAKAESAEIPARNLSELTRILDRDGSVAAPIRPLGAGTSSTDCNASPGGTRLRLTGFDQIINIDPVNHTVTAQASVRLYQLAEALAQRGLELPGSYEMMGRTLGGAIAAPCFGPSIGRQNGSLAAHVKSVRMVTGAGKLLTIGAAQKDLLAALRGSFGLLGVIAEVTLGVQPIATFAASHRSLSVDEFSGIVDTLSASDVGFRFCLLPHRDRVYLDLRRYANDDGSAWNAPWKLKDWGESTVLPQICKSLSRLLPIQSVRYRLIDSVSEATQSIVNSRFVSHGSNASNRAQYRTASSTRPLHYSTWCFAATDFSVVLKAYREFCQTMLADNGYRCDVPVIGYRIAQDQSSLLSPSWDEPLIALQTASSQANGWEDFVIDLADFAEHWGGVPLFSQSRAARADYAKQVYGRRLEFFRRLRRQLDPEDRLLTPWLAQYFQ